MKIAVIPNLTKDPELIYSNKVKEYLASEEAEIIDYGKSLEGYDVAVVIGGDGTILEIAGEAARTNTPIIGINFGNLGFLSQIEKADIEKIKNILSDFKTKDVMMLSGKINGKEEVNALNDVVIRGDISRMVSLEIYIDGEKAGEYSADGVIFSTPTGSTAYSLSAGGPIIHPKMDGILITPICPHSLDARSMVIPPDCRVEVKIVPPYRTKPVLTADGKTVKTIENDDTVEITRSALRLKLIEIDDNNFFEVLGRKIK